MLCCHLTTVTCCTSECNRARARSLSHTHSAAVPAMTTTVYSDARQQFCGRKYFLVVIVLHGNNTLQLTNAISR